MMALYDHLLRDAARFRQRLSRPGINFGGQVALNCGQLLVKNTGHQCRTELDRLAILGWDTDLVSYPLRNHQTVDSVGRQIFHETIEQAGALSVEHPVAI